MALANISGNFRKISRNIKFPEIYNPSVMCCSNTAMCRARRDVIWDAGGMAVLAHVRQCDSLSVRRTTQTTHCVECLITHHSSSSSSSCQSGDLRTSTSSTNSRSLWRVPRYTYCHRVTTACTATHGMLRLTVHLYHLYSSCLLYTSDAADE